MRLTRLTQLTLFKKLLFSFLIVLLLLSAISITAITNMDSMGEKSKQTTEIGLTNVILLGNLNHNLMELDDLMLRIQLNLENQVEDSIGTEVESQVDKASRLFKEIQDKTTKLDGIAFTDKDTALIKFFNKSWESYATRFPGILQSVQNHGPEGMTLIRQGNTFLSSCSATISMLSRNNQDYAHGWADELTSSYKTGVTWVVALSIIAIVAGLAVSYLIAKHVSKPIQDMSSTAKRVSSGDLSAQYQALSRKDEIGELSVAFGQMTGHMRQMIMKINEHASLVAASADQLNASSNEMQTASERIAETVKDVADGAAKQTLSMEETSRSMEEVGAGIGRLAENASSIAETVESSRQQAEIGGASIQSTVQQMSSRPSLTLTTSSSRIRKLRLRFRRWRQRPKKCRPAPSKLRLLSSRLQLLPISHLQLRRM